MLCTYVIEDLNGKEIVGTFHENKLHIKKSLELKKQSKEKAINYMSKKKIMIIRLIAG